MNPKEFEMYQNARLGLVSLEENWEIVAETERVKARLKKVFYDECVAAGFNASQALELTAKHNPFG